MIKGNTHKTIIRKNVVIQHLNSKLKVPSKKKVNKLIDLLRDNDIVAAKVIYQNKNKRILEKLEGTFYRKFTFNQCLQAMKFLRKLHIVLEKAEPIGDFHIVKEFGDGKSMIWGDVNASNFLWRKGKIVGVVDYDCVMKGDTGLDIVMAIVNWQKDFTYKKSKSLFLAYGIDISCYWIEKIQKYILLTHKQYSDVSFKLGLIKKNRKYCLSRILTLNKQYEKSIIWRSL